MKHVNDWCFRGVYNGGLGKRIFITLPILLALFSNLSRKIEKNPALLPVDFNFYM